MPLEGAFHRGLQQRTGSAGAVSELLDSARHRHDPGEGAGLQARASAKLVDMEAKIADLTVIADTLRATLSAGCDDLAGCAGSPDCPIPFTGLTARATGSPAGRW
jgi:hypothetical protein